MLTTSDQVRRIMRRLIPAVLAGMFSFVAVGFLIATILLACLEVMPAPLATLSTALVFALIAGSLFALSRSQRKRRRRPATSDLLDGLVPALHLAVGKKPLASLAVATVLGVVSEITMKSGASQRRRD